MSSFSNIKQEINYNIADNDSQAITAAILRTTLIDMVDATDTNIVQSDWDETNPLSNAYIKNKPAAPAGQQQADWTENDDTSVTYIKHKPTIPTNLSQLYNDANYVQDADYHHTDNNFTNAYMVKLDGIQSGAEANVQSDWNESDPSSDSYIKNKPSIPSGQQQADWDVTDTSSVTYIKNKPTIPTVPTNVSAFVNDVNYAYLVDIPTKVSELSNDLGFAYSTDIPTKVSELDNDLGFAYAANIPTKLSELTNDANYVQDANYVHTDNNFTNSYMTKLDGIAAGAEVNVQSDWNVSSTGSDAYILNKPFIPTKTSDLVNDSGFGDVSAVQAQLDTVERVTSYALNYLNTYCVQDLNYVHTDNNFTTAYMTKLDGIEAGAEVNVQSDWNESNSSSDGYILNKPNLNNYVSKTELNNASYVSSTYISNIVKMTTTEYYNLDNPDANTLYLCN